MSRRKKPTNWLRILVLLGLVAGALYINQVVVPATPPLFIPTPTPTRSPESFLNDAQSLIQKGKINQAIEMYKEAVKADPQNPAIYVTLARWQVLYGDLPGAMENAQNALLNNSNYALAHAVRGWILGKQGNFLEGEAEIKKALDLDPNSALAYAYLSEIYKDKIEQGKEDFNTRDQVAEVSRKAVDLDSSLMEVHRARGLALEVNGKYEDAIKEFESAVQMNNNLADLHIALGRNYKAVQSYDRAVEQFNLAISLKPDDSEPYAELARTYLTAGEYAKGIQLAEQALQKSPKDPSMYSLLGTLNYKNKDYKAAIPMLRLAVKGGLAQTGDQVQGIPLDNSVPAVNLYTRYGLALAYTGECGEALEVAQSILKVVPDDQDAAYNAQVMVDSCKEQAAGAAPPAGAGGTGTVTPGVEPTVTPTKKP